MNYNIGIERKDYTTLELHSLSSINLTTRNILLIL